MSALSHGSGLAARMAPANPGTRGFLHIVRHGGGPSAIYVVTYHRLDAEGAHPKPALAEGAGSSRRHPAAWLSKYSGFVAERRGDAGKRTRRKLALALFIKTP